MKRLVVLVFGVALLCIYGSEFEKISEFTTSHNDNIEGRFIKLSDDNVLGYNFTSKMMIFNFPSNPTTQCVDLGFLESLVEIALKNDIFFVDKQSIQVSAIRDFCNKVKTKTKKNKYVYSRRIKTIAPKCIWSAIFFTFSEPSS